jgi:F1F0 ATPase subunit 2
MNNTVILALSGGAGLVLGAFFFGGLWWTVRRGLSSPRPALWFLGSLVVRTSVILAGFILVSGGHWDRLLACLLGFPLARLLVTRLTCPPLEPHNLRTKETRHAP